MQAVQNILRRKLEVILQRAFIEARNLALNKAHQQIFDLADTFEAIPPLLAKEDENHVDQIRGLLKCYQQKYQGLAYDYLSILEMPDRDFVNVFETREPF